MGDIIMEVNNDVEKNNLLNDIISYTKEKIETYMSSYSKYKDDYQNLKSEIMNLSIFKELVEENNKLLEKQNSNNETEHMVNTINSLNAFSKIVEENSRLKEEIKKYKNMSVVTEDVKERITMTIDEKKNNNIADNIKALQEKNNLTAIKSNILPPNTSCSVKRVVTIEETVTEEDDGEVYYQEYKCNDCDYQTHDDD